MTGGLFWWRRRVREVLPLLAFGGMLAWVTVLQPQSLSYSGLSLLLAGAVPLLLATTAQMFVITIGDIDLGIGNFVGLVNVAVAQFMGGALPLTLALLAGLVLLYGLLGALIHMRRIPSIVATLGASFVWLGAGFLIRPIPGGSAPGWLVQLFNLQLPLVPLAVCVAVATALASWLLATRLRYGVAVRAAGSNPEAVARAGWSLVRLRVGAYCMAGLFGVLAGLAVTAATGSGDATASSNYTLLTVAAVILGGGEFAGGVAVPVGAVLGALVISLVGSVLALINVASSFQSALQGLILILVMAMRAALRAEPR